MSDQSPREMPAAWQQYEGRKANLEDTQRLFEIIDELQKPDPHPHLRDAARELLLLIEASSAGMRGGTDNLSGLEIPLRAMPRISRYDWSSGAAYPFSGTSPEYQAPLLQGIVPYDLEEGYYTINRFMEAALNRPPGYLAVHLVRVGTGDEWGPDAVEGWVALTDLKLVETEDIRIVD